MGGRGSAMNVTTFGTKYGTRMTPTQYKEAVNAKANFIFGELERNDAIQIILKRSFKNGVPVIEVSSDGINIIVERGLQNAVIKELQTLADQFNQDKNSALKAMHGTKTWSEYDEQRAQRQASLQAFRTLKEAIELLKKRR